MVLDRSSKIEILDADMCNPKASLFITNGGAAKLGTSKKSRWLENGDITYDPQINGHAGYPVTADWTEVWPADRGKPDGSMSNTRMFFNQ